MKLPYHANATIAEAKITQYLLSETHEDGRSKATFFLRLGFSVAQWEMMRDALLAHGAEYEVASILDTTRGKHYTVEGELVTPSGSQPLIRTVWALETGSEIPRLITAYPLKRKKGEQHDSGT